MRERPGDGARADLSGCGTQRAAASLSLRRGIVAIRIAEAREESGVAEDAATSSGNKDSLAR